MIDVRDVRRVQWAAVIHLGLATALVAIQVRAHPTLTRDWLVLWLCAGGVPAAAAWLGLSRVRKSASSTALRQLLLVPMFVATAVIACIFDLVRGLSGL